MIGTTERVIRFHSAFWTCHTAGLSHSHRPFAKGWSNERHTLFLRGIRRPGTNRKRGGRDTHRYERTLHDVPGRGRLPALGQTDRRSSDVRSHRQYLGLHIRRGPTSAPPAELSRLQQENKDLKERVKALEEALETSTPPPPPGPPGGKLQLPTDQEVDQALDYLERVYKKFRDRVKDLDKPLPPPAAEPAPPPKAPL